MNNLYRRLYSFFVKPFIRRRIRKKTNFSYGGLDLVVYPGVFHPGYFFSSTFFLDYIYELDLTGKTFCELGCGSGMISLQAYKNKGKVLALDISNAALDNLRENFRLNFNGKEHPEFTILKSDLFDNVPAQHFDFVYINPPYFFKEALTDEQRAWNCGRDGEYFAKLFSQLQRYTDFNSTVWMVLGDSTDINRIKKMGAEAGWEMQVVHKKKIRWEWNFIYRLDKI